jgi:PKD repeat protein
VCLLHTHTHTHTHRNAGFQRNFLVIMMLVALMLKVDVGWGQGNPSQICPNNLLENPDFAFSGVDDGYDAFCQGFVNNWRGLDFTPHIIQLDPLGNTDCDIVISDASNTMACLRSGPADQIAITESIAQQGLTFSPDPLVTYFIDISARLLDCGRLNSFTNLDVYLLNSNEFPQGCANPSAGWTPVVSQQIVNSQVNWYNTQNVFENFSIANPTFNAIYIRSWKPYPPTEINQTVLGLENVVLACQTTALTDLTVNNTSGLSYAFGSVNSSTISTFTDYLWTFTKNCNSQIVFQSTNSNPSYTFTEGGQYEICLDIRDNFGCCATRCENLNVPCSPPMSVFTSEVSCVNNENIVSFTQSSGSCLTYLWNFGDNSTSTTQNPIHEYINNGTYTVTLTVTDACGNTSSTIQQVQVNCLQPNCGDGEPCISIGTPGGTVLLSTLIAGPNPIIPHTTWFFAPVVQNICFNLEGTLILDIPGAFFINTTWFCGSGASIRINDFGAWGSHWFVDSQLLGCSTMWRGIVLEPNPSGNFFVGGLTLRNTTIFDAYRGVELAGGRVINAEGSSFIDNYVGTYVPANGFNNFTDCRFENTGAMLPPYAGQPSWASRMHAGIEGNNVTLVRVTGTEGNSRSLFRNLSHGIKTFRSGVAVENSRFEIDDITSKQNSYYSYGIFEDKPNSFSVIFRNNFSSVNSCIYSSEGTMNGLQISNNILNLNSSFAQCHGIGIYSSNNINISISQINTFNINNEGGRAISVNTCNYNNLNIDENIFNVETSLGSQDLISIQNNTPLGSEGLIRENEFYLSKMRDIYITNSPKIVLLKNTYFYESARNLIGNSPNVFVKGNINSITGKTSWINISESQKVKICCNESNSPTGPSLVYTGGGNLDNKIVGNSINYFYLYNGTIAGLQPSHGNVFDPSGSQASINFYVPDIPYYQANRFRVDNTQIGNRPTWINEPWMIDEFFPLDGVSGGCGSYSSCNSDVFDLPVIDPDSIPLARMAQTITDDEADLTLTNYVNADRVFNNEQYPYRHRHIWENHYHLYQQVQKHPSIDWHSKLNSLEAGNILNENLTQGMIDWADVEQKRAKLYEMSEIQWEMYHQNQKVLKDVGVSIKNWYTDTNQEKDPNTLTALHNQLNDAYQNIKEIGIEINSRVQEAMVSLSSDIVALDESLPFIAERKKVWQIDAIRIQSGIESITNAEWEEIERIAALCPLEYGSAVYEAHGLLMTKGVADSSYDFEQNCISFAENRSKSAIQDESIEVFPNPTTGLIHINFANNNLADKFILSNLLGQKIYEYTIPENQTQIDLDLSPMENGIYMFNILCKNQTIQKGKVIIID